MKTVVGANEKETGLIVDKLYQALLHMYELCDGCEFDDVDKIQAVLKEFEDKYGRQDS